MIKRNLYLNFNVLYTKLTFNNSNKTEILCNDNYVLFFSLMELRSETADIAEPDKM